MTNKIKITEARKKAIKKNFDFNKPPKRKNELAYFNKIKAGKIRFADSFRDKAGKLTAFPDKFMNDFVNPIAKSKGLTAKEFLSQKANRAEAQRLFKVERLDHFFNDKTILKFITNLPTRTTLFIYTGEAKIKVNKLELDLYTNQLKQELYRLDRPLIFFKVSLVKGFEEAYFWLPDIKKMLKLYELDKLNKLKNKR